jgi:septum formation topological specificity factor MinE
LISYIGAGEKKTQGLGMRCPERCGPHEARPAALTLVITAAELTFLDMTITATFGDCNLAPWPLPAWPFVDAQQEITRETLADAFTEIASYRQAMVKQQRLIDELYRRVETQLPAEIEALADWLHEHEERSRGPSVERLAIIVEHVRLYRKSRARNARSVVRLGEEIIDVIVDWLDLYQNLEIRLRKLASDRAGALPSDTFSDGTEAVRYLRSIRR